MGGQVRSAYERAKNRLIVADYDGTLTQLQSVPQVRHTYTDRQAEGRSGRCLTPGVGVSAVIAMSGGGQLATPSPYITNLLDSLSRDPKNTVVIVSGREKRFMDTWLGKLKVDGGTRHMHHGPHHTPTHNSP